MGGVGSGRKGDRKTPVYLKFWRDRNKKKVDAINKKSYNNNKDKILRRTNEYREENKDKIRKQRQDYWIRKKVKVLTRYLSKLRYENRNKGRHKKYYDSNSIEICKQKKLKRQKHEEAIHINFRNHCGAASDFTNHRTCRSHKTLAQSCRRECYTWPGA